MASIGLGEAESFPLHKGTAHRHIDIASVSSLDWRLFMV